MVVAVVLEWWCWRLWYTTVPRLVKNNYADFFFTQTCYSFNCLLSLSLCLSYLYCKTHLSIFPDHYWMPSSPTTELYTQNSQYLLCRLLSLFLHYIQYGGLHFPREWQKIPRSWFMYSLWFLPKPLLPYQVFMSFIGRQYTQYLYQQSTPYEQYGIQLLIY